MLDGLLNVLYYFRFLWFTCVFLSMIFGPLKALKISGADTIGKLVFDLLHILFEWV